MKRKVTEMLKLFADGEFEISGKRKPKPERRPPKHVEETIAERYKTWHDIGAMRLFSNIYRGASLVICLLVITALLVTVSYLPPFGDVTNPVNNEVSERYIEKGLEETGAVNVVSGMILDYRAFDTFGESAVLFIASVCVFVLLKDEPSEEKKRSKKGKKTVNRGVARPASVDIERDSIVKNVAKVLIPLLLIFGVYVVLNGHISPGGGFSGGAIMGASLILYSSAYGHKAVSAVITERTVKGITFSALSFYAVAKGYSFFTGANHIPTGIPLGEPGAILSAGLILPLNICVAMVVTCTMYSFYSLFSKGEV